MPLLVGGDNDVADGFSTLDSWPLAADAIRVAKILGPGMPLARPEGPEVEPASAVRQQGVALLPGILGMKTAAALRDFVLIELNASLGAAVANASRTAEALTEGIRQAREAANKPQTRWELKLPMAPLVQAALSEVFESPLARAFEDLAGGLEAELWELTAIVSMPGAVPQDLHYDTETSRTPCLFTAFVALQDIERDMGPTRFLLRTHVPEAHRRFVSLNSEERTDFLKETHSAVALLRTGDAALYDSRVLHGGCDNYSDKIRVLLVITFRHVDSQELSRSTQKVRGSHCQLRDFTLAALA